ncbi:MAG: hypothetical protein ACPG5T_03250 [Endozoicomonas sp.]
MDEDGLLNSDELLDVIHSFPVRIRHLFFWPRSPERFRQLAGNQLFMPLSLVHQTPFDFIERKVTAASPESPQYHQVQTYDDRGLCMPGTFCIVTPLLMLSDVPATLTPDRHHLMTGEKP